MTARLLCPVRRASLHEYLLRVGRRGPVLRAGCGRISELWAPSDFFRLAPADNGDSFQHLNNVRHFPRDR